MEAKPRGWYTGVVHLNDLPDKVWLKLEDKISNNIILSLRKEAKDFAELAEEIKEPIHYAKQYKYVLRNAYSLRNFIVGKCISLKLLRKISIFLTSKGHKEFELVNIEKNIKYIKAGKNGKPIFNPKFPIGLCSAQGARFIAAILCDGCIDINQTSSYRNESLELRNSVIESTKSIFGDFKADISKGQVRLPTIISKILIYCIGLPYGKKTVNNVSAPDFILKSRDGVIIKHFLRQAFDDEGSVTGNTNRAKHITLELSVDVSKASERKVPKLLLDIMKMLNKFEIEFHGPYFSREHVCKDGRKLNSWSIYIGNIKNLHNFSERVGFSSISKSRKLENSIMQIERNLEMKQRQKEDMIMKIDELQKRYGIITSRHLNKEYGIKLSTASSWLTRFENKGILKKIHSSWKPKETRRIFIFKK